MRITVLGKSPSWADAGGACTGFLVEEGSYKLLLDCGGGVFAKLRREHDYLDIDAVLLTHPHSDHFFDLVPFSYALTNTERVADAPRPALWVPPGVPAIFRQTIGAWGDESLIETAFELREYDPGGELELGPLRARFREVPHFVETFAIELSAGPRRFTFGADCGPNEGLVEFARDTDLLLIEATLTEPEPDGPRGHLTPREAGDHARRAGARRVVITHFSDELDEGHLRAAASDAFGALVELARERAVYDV